MRAILLVWTLVASLLTISPTFASADEEYPEVILHIGESLWPCFAVSYYVESREIWSFSQEGYYKVVVVDDAQSEISLLPYKEACQDSYDLIIREDIPFSNWEGVQLYFHPRLFEDVTNEISARATSTGDPFVPISLAFDTIETLVEIMRACEEYVSYFKLADMCDPSRFTPSISRLTDIVETALADHASRYPASGVMAYFRPKVAKYREIVAQD